MVACCEQGTPETMAAGRCDSQSELSLEPVLLVKKRGQRLLMMGLCPEDIMNSSTSLNDNSIGQLKGETLPSEVKTPLIMIQSPFTTNLHSTPVHLHDHTTVNQEIFVVKIFL